MSDNPPPEHGDQELSRQSDQPPSPTQPPGGVVQPDLPPGTPTPPAGGPPYTKENLLWAIGRVFDPEIRISIVDLGLVYEAVYDEETRLVNVKMTMTSMGCPVIPQILGEVKDALLTLEGVDDALVELVWKPVWDPKVHASEEVKMMLNIW